MQPTYLPWIGYFDLINQADIFVFFDSVQFDKRSWQQRNRIKTSNGELMLTVPVLSKGRFGQKICEVEVDDSQRFRQRHLRTIRRYYSKSRFFDDYFNELEVLFHDSCSRLVDLNTNLIRWLCDKFDIQTEFISSSTLHVEGAKAELLVDICRAVGADHYISPIGASTYIEPDNLFELALIRLSYQRYQHPSYEQLYGEFIPYMSAIDLLFNEGGGAKEILTQGSR